MKKFLSIFIIVIFTLATLPGCGGRFMSKSLDGEYYCYDEYGNIYSYVEFDSEDSTMSLFDGEDDLVGHFKYTIEDDEIILNQVTVTGYGSDEALSFSQKGNTIYINGMEFIKN